MIPEAERKIEPPQSGDGFNEVEDVIYRRRSVRAYKKAQIPEYLIRRILETGRFAPSAGNGQSWKFMVIRDGEMIEEMTRDVVRKCRRIARLFDYTEPGRERRMWRAKAAQRLMPRALHPVPFGAIKLIAEGRLGVWHGAPTVILLLADRRTPGDERLDLGIAGQNMVLTAHSYGLGTCWVSFATLLAGSKNWKKRLGVEYPYRLYTSIAVGWPKGTPDGYVTRETQAIDWYDEDGFKVVF
jgi:nitroreductase